jgi:15-cis-phytoene synthase
VYPTTYATSPAEELYVSQLVGSSQYRALSDDALKDEDNVAWVMQLAPPIRTQWVERIGWIRLVDRLAENELLDARSHKFQQFCRDWQQLQHQGQISPDSPYESVLKGIQSAWFDRIEIDPHPIAAWEDYLGAIACYHRPGLTIASVAEYEQMLDGLAGRFFQILPFLAPSDRRAARAFGKLDQFYNNLRDLSEDAQQGICYFPTELLDRFGLTCQDIVEANCFDRAGYYQLVEFWLDDFLPRLRQPAEELVRSPHLHPSWRLLCDWSIARYRRIDLVFRYCQFNYVQFPAIYWAAVKQDLEHWQTAAHLSP